MVFKLDYKHTKQLAARKEKRRWTPHLENKRRFENGQLKQARMIMYSNSVDKKYRISKSHPFVNRKKMTKQFSKSGKDMLKSTKSKAIKKTMQHNIIKSDPLPKTKQMLKNEKLNQERIDELKKDIEELIASKFSKRKELEKLPEFDVQINFDTFTKKLDDLKLKNIKRVKDLADRDIEHKLKRKKSKSNLCVRHKISRSENSKSEKVVICQLCGWASLSSKFWDNRITAKCENCLELLYCDQIREYRYEARDLLDQNEKIETVKKNHSKIEEGKFRVEVNW